MTSNRFTSVFDDLRKAIKQHRTLVLYGGSSSSKTISILQYLTIYAIKYPNKVITLVAESYPVLKKTLIQDWKTIIMGDYFDRRRWNGTDMTYTYESGSQFQFMPADDESRYHGPRRDVLYLDEVFYIKKGVYDQASIRTREKVIMSFNPRAEFWVRYLMDEAETWVHHSTYTDNPYVEQTIIDELEKRIKTDPNFHRVYTLGLWGSLEGLIFKEGTHWVITTDWPEDFKQEIYGLDFGYSIDPAALVHIRYANGQLYIKELLYRREMLNSDISEHLNGLTIADSAEPKSIAELQKLGHKVLGSVKGKDSINSGIQLMKQFKINVTNDSLNLIKELRSYQWDEDRHGEQLTKPIDRDQHAIDASRYAINHLFAGRGEFTLT